MKNGQLSVQDGRETFPVEDINCVMIDSLRTYVTTYALNQLVAAGATVILCDEKHTPANIVLPYQGYYRRLSVLELQNNISKPRKKQLWQQIIRRKLEGQAECLRAFKKDKEAEKLELLAKQVNSNDSDNKEAEGARLYFPALFGSGFTRGEDNAINGSLNYAYAIVRSLIARQLCARGFECAFGIFHKSQLNAFNLADDMIEPFRPIIDFFVENIRIYSNGAGELNKRELFGIVNLEVDSGGQKHSLSNAVERLAESLLAYFKGEREDIVMPRLVGMNMHTYE
ncbi:MAG: type II CRISPR-associated endonuclease Cas1 [Muribaculaceae bacterium]|nr:type II CRISPR-associated endonuclease Cas1 [Muribaculaceae bacterium]